MKISLLLPYWDRQEAADKALRLIARQYADLDLEVIIVDDGNAVPFRLPVWFNDEIGDVTEPAVKRLNIRVITLPRKKDPKSPCTPWNVAAKAANGDMLVLSCIEILHDKPVLEELARAVAAGGSDAYVLAAAYCPESGEWHCHSKVEVPTCPPGSGIGFCSAMHKELYFRAGGFDEIYRDGAGYEDRDFIWRLHNAGAKFIKRDDLVVTHPKSGASIAWGFEKFQRNEGIYLARWTGKPTKKVTFCCVQAGNYCGRGAEYVNILYDMIVRAMPPGVVFRLVCLTDDPAGLHKDIETIALPPEIRGWYGKLYMFKPDLFADGERVIYFDLDTLIVGKLDDLVAYEGQFATLEDFYYPNRVGPAVIAWEAGFKASRIWSRWVTEGRPENPLGDLWWLNELDGGDFAKRADKLQTLFPGAFASFKRDCDPYPPKGTKVVCFHGLPRPHEAAETDEWVAMAWRVGGANKVDFEIVGNTAYDQAGRNIEAACKLDIPWLPLVKDIRPEPVAIVGGGPSLASMLDELRENAAHGMKIFATNGAHDYLVSKGIIPDAHVMIDARAENARFVTAPARQYYLASQCAEEVFDRVNGAPVTLLHMNTRGVLAHIPQNIKPVNLISSGSSVGLAAMAIAYCLGYRKLNVYGMDSSYSDAQHHVYDQSLNDADRVIDAIAGGRTFKCAPWMVAQVEHFQALAKELIEDDCEISVRCGGLLGHVAWLWMQQAAGNEMMATKEEMTA